ncbi:MAG: hypothetical protein IJH63_03335 [Methanobrevibacter sp.]|nr:hypothetical protein [Methanobrevibacter sp.]
MTESVNPFVENTDGILTHSGEIKVAKGGVEQRILNISDEGNVLMRGRKNSYTALIHVKLLPLIKYAEKGDVGFIKFRRGEPFIVGFRKQKRADKYERKT